MGVPAREAWAEGKCTAPPTPVHCPQHSGGREGGREGGRASQLSPGSQHLITQNLPPGARQKTTGDLHLGDGTKAQLHQRSSERPRWDIHTGGPAWSLENEAELHTGTGSRHQTTTPHQNHGPGRMTACAHGLWRMLPVRQPWLRTEKLPEDNGARVTEGPRHSGPHLPVSARDQRDSRQHGVRSPHEPLEFTWRDACLPRTPDSTAPTRAAAHFGRARALSAQIKHPTQGSR
ncbi:hypothetical protein Cadr_000028088 [Camelus dromedarius]|uniref:Uncharacterized protein n=1 Tax=Camelus dromedarius TaxID=9838 RepID=A0A5N4C9A6_CAMDR|nr:hypothetical protein Cadr_000028088 [Camelus dromedarius]